MPAPKDKIGRLIYCFRISKSGKGIKKPHSEEHKKNLSLALIGKLCGEKNPNYGRRHTPEERKKMSDANKGERHPCWGKHHSDDRKKKISEAQIGKFVSEETKQKIRTNTKLAMARPDVREKYLKGLNDFHFNPINKKWFCEHQKEVRSKRIIPIKDSSIELKFQNTLRQLNIDFIKHKHISDIEHRYICDIFIPSKKLVIECDGCYWHSCLICYPNGSGCMNSYDAIRSVELTERGYRILRFWEHDINNNIEECIRIIQSVILWTFIETEVRHSELILHDSSDCMRSNVQHSLSNTECVSVN